MTERVGALLLAIGASPELASDAPRARLSGRPLLGWSLRALARSPLISRVAVVVSDRLDEAGCLATGLGSVAVLGARDYRAGLAAGLGELADCAWLVLYDAARPLLDDRVLKLGLEAARATGAAVAALEARETIKRVADGTVVETSPRHELWNVQTPLVLRSQLLRSALRDDEIDISGEAGLLARLAGRLAVFPGSPESRKLTTPTDLAVAEARLADRRDVPRRTPPPRKDGRFEPPIIGRQRGKRRVAG